MEKTTKERTGSGLVTDSADWARAALAAAMALTPQRLVRGREGEQPGSPAAATGRGRRGRRSKLPPPSTRWGPHRHAITEVCLALEGSASLVMGDRVCPFAPPSLAIIPAGIWHYEARGRGTGGYALLWLAPSETALGCSVSRYDLERGWDCPWRFRSLHPACGHLNELLAGTDGTLPGHRFDSFMADLLAVFSEAHRQWSVAIEQGRDGGPSSHHDAAVAVVKNYLDVHLDQRLTLRGVADLVYLSPNHLNAIFRRREGCGIHHYLIARRMEKAMQLCRKGSLLIKQVATRVGYADPLYFSRAFRDWHGVWPSQVQATVDEKPHHLV